MQVDNCQLQEQLKKCEDERNFFHQYYQYYHTHPFNNNHQAQDYKRQDGEDMKNDPVDLRRDFGLNGANRGESTGKLEPDERFRGDQQSQLVEELLAAGEDPTALGVVWRKEIGQKVCKQLVQEEQVGRSNGYPVSALAAAVVEDELQLVHEHKVVLNLRHY